VWFAWFCYQSSVKSRFEVQQKNAVVFNSILTFCVKFEEEQILEIEYFHHFEFHLKVMKFQDLRKRTETFSD